MSESLPNGHLKTTRRRTRSLVIACGVIVIVWGGLLPWLSRTDVAQARLRSLDERQIDASALFYTDLDYLDAVLQERGL